MAWCARDTYRMKVASLQTTEYFARMHDRFGMILEKATLTFSNSRRQLASNAHELEELTSFIQHMLHERITKIMLIKFPILAGCSTRVMEKVAVLLMGSTTIHPGFHGDGIP